MIENAQFATQNTLIILFEIPNYILYSPFTSPLREAQLGVSRRRRWPSQKYPSLVTVYRLWYLERLMPHLNLRNIHCVGLKGVWLSQTWPIRRGIVTSANSGEVTCAITTQSRVTFRHDVDPASQDAINTNYPARGKTKGNATGRHDAKTLDPKATSSHPRVTLRTIRSRAAKAELRRGNSFRR